MSVRIWGSTGYMGSAIALECDRRGLRWAAGSRNPDLLTSQTRACSLAINCAAYIPFPTVDACKLNRDEAVLGNIVWPTMLREACRLHDVPLMHLSTGCLFDEQREYSETDEPTRGWDGYCGEYVGGKKLAERIVSEWEQHYILRLRLPFDEFDHPRNYLSKLAGFEQVFDHFNSLTHRGDFAKWALDLYQKCCSFGTYHCVNAGQISAIELVTRMIKIGIISKAAEFVKSPGTNGARLSVKKLSDAGIKVRHVEEALDEALSNWKSK